MECVVDLTELDPVPPQFDLLIDPTEELETPVTIDAYKITAAIDALLPAPRRQDEFFGGQLRAAQIALGDTGPANQQLSGGSVGHQLQRWVHHPSQVPGKRSPDTDRLPDGQLVCGSNDRRLGRPVRVDHSTSGPTPPPHKIGWADFTSKD